MSIPETGPISLSDLKGEFGSSGSSSILSDFYSNLNCNIPRRYTVPNYGSPLSLSSFRGVQSYSSILEDRVTWSGNYGALSETNLGGVLDFISPDNTTKGIRKTFSVVNSQNKKHRWIVVAATHFHWLDGGGGMYGAGLFRNIRLASGEQGILLKDRVNNYVGESHSVYIKAFPIPDTLASVDLVLEQPYGGYNPDTGVLEWPSMWGEYQLSVIGLSGIGDNPAFRTFDTDGFNGPFNASLNSGVGDDTVPRKSVGVIAICGRGGNAGICSDTDESHIFNGQGVYLDHNLSSSTIVYAAQHSTVALMSSIVIDY